MVTIDEPKLEYVVHYNDLDILKEVLSERKINYTVVVRLATRKELYGELFSLFGISW